jgi:hypothetical protein
MFRYFTGAIAMATAVVILIFVIGHPADSTFPAIFLVVLAAIQWSRRSP